MLCVTGSRRLASLHVCLTTLLCRCVCGSLLCVVCFALTLHVALGPHELVLGWLAAMPNVMHNMAIAGAGPGQRIHGPHREVGTLQVPTAAQFPQGTLREDGVQKPLERHQGSLQVESKEDNVLMRQPKAITMPPILNKSLLPSLEEDRTKEREIPLSTITSMQALPV